MKSLDNLGLNDDFHPILRFIGLFQDNAELRDEVGLGAPSASGSIVRSHRCPCLEELVTNKSALFRSWQLPAQSNNSLRKVLGPLLHFLWNHDCSGAN